MPIMNASNDFGTNAARLARRRSVAVAAVLAVVALVVALTPGVAAATVRTANTAAPMTGPARAVDMSTFNPGNIISDEVFFDRATMTEGDVQAFLNARGERCQSGYTCLRDYRMTTSSKPADSYCAGYSGAANESAARIIAKVAESCGINPQVLLVTLQKEQTLVTRSDPGAGHYKFAMGQGCPDTAACDSRYYGFQNQVYGAARQFQIYAEGRYFTWYAPGRTWNILYHPDSSRGCGSSPVFIQNKATAGLYYYTPYQPNRAALAAGSGEGDRCSSYGNRNFFRFFSDWFGSTQRSSPKIIRATGGDAVYLVSDGAKFHIRTYDDLLAFQSRLGAVAQVDASYASIFPTRGTISRYVHDPRTGTLYLLEADGTRHRFPSEALVRALGFDFNSYVNLAGSLIDQFANGPEVNDFVRVSNGGEVFRLEGSTTRYVPTLEIWRATSAGTPYAASVNAEVAARWSAGATLLPAGGMIREASAADVMFVGKGTDLLHVRSLDTARDWGVTDLYVVPTGALRGWTRSAGWLAPVISCGSTTVAASGRGAVLVGLAPSVTGPVAVAGSLCGALRQDGGGISTPLFVTTRDDGRAYEVRSGKLDYVSTYPELLARNGGTAPRVLDWSRASADAKGYVVPAVSEGQLVQFSDAGEVYVMRSKKLLHVPTYEQLRDMSAGVPRVLSVEARHRSAFTFGPALLLDGQIVQFRGANEVYLVERSQLRYISSYGKLVSLGGGRVPSIITIAPEQRAEYRFGADY